MSYYTEDMVSMYQMLKRMYSDQTTDVSLFTVTKQNQVAYFHIISFKHPQNCCIHYAFCSLWTVNYFHNKHTEILHQYCYKTELSPLFLCCFLYFLPVEIIPPPWKYKSWCHSYSCFQQRLGQKNKFEVTDRAWAFSSLSWS